MRITIDDIDIASARPMGNIRMPGYIVSFTSAMVNGTAIFVPADTASRDMCGQTFHVEINQEAIEDFTEFPGGDPREYWVSAGRRTGDYVVAGVIACVDPFIMVSAGDMSFFVSPDELGGCTVHPGLWVKFTAKDVSLWDEAI